MKKSVKIISITIFIVALFTMIIGGAIGKMIIFWCSFAVIMIEAVSFLWWQKVSLDWKCKKCGTVFSINLFSMIKGINSGNVKKLTCPNCKEKQWCEPVVRGR